MRKYLAMTIGLMLVGGCGDSREKVTKDSISVMSKVASTLEGIKDEASAKAATPTLTDLQKQMQEISARADKLPTPSAEETTALEEKYKKELVEVASRMMKESMRISMDPKLRPYLQPIQSGLSSSPPAPRRP